MVKTSCPLVLLTAVAFLWGCASTGTADEASARSDASKAVEGVFHAYRSYTRQGFEQRLRPDFAPARAEFVQAAESAFAAARLLELSFVLDRAMPAGDSLAAELSWHKKVQPRAAGGPVLTSGRAGFVFKRGGGDWLLYRVKGDNPFQ